MANATDFSNILKKQLFVTSRYFRISAILPEWKRKG